MPHTSNRFRRLRLGILVLLAACGEGDGTPTTPQNPGGNPGGSVQEASAPALSASNVAMMGGLGLSGLPSGRDDFIVEVAVPGSSVPDSAGDFILPLLPLDDGSYSVWIPIHPTDSTDGGAVELRVRDDADFVTRPATVTLDALPPAPGAFVELLDSLQALLDLRFAEAGTTAADVLAADWSTALDPELLPFAIAQAFIDDPGSTADLRALSDGSDAFAPYFGSGGFDRGLLDRYTAAGGAQDAVNASLAALRAGPSPTPGEGPHGAGSLSAAELDRKMEEAWAAAREIDPNSATGQLLAGYGLGLGAAGVVAGPAGAVAAAGLGAALWAYQTYLEGKSKLLPREFVAGSLLFDLSIQEFEEDRPGPATWSNVRVSAQSQGWSVEKAAVDLLLQLAGGARAFGSWATKVADKVPTSVDALYFVRDQGLSRAAANADGLITIDPEVWLDVDISGTDFSEARLGPGAAIELVAGTNEYNPINAGQQLLTVSTNPARFGDATPAFHRETVEVLPIEVQVIPSKTTVKPNELIDFQILVSNFVSDDLSWTLSGGTWSVQPNKIGQGTWTAQAQMPASGFPVHVTFKSEATGGARDTPGAPPREGTATLSNVTVVVDPPQKIMRRGESQQFVSTVLGTPNQNVTWSVSGPGAASVGSNGQFTAPDVLGEYLITATSDEDPSAEGFANVTVVGECYYNITLGTEIFTGDEISHVFGSSTALATVSWTRANGAGFMYPESLVSGVTGSAASAFSFQNGSQAWVATVDGNDGTGVTLTVTENTGDAVVGQATGTVVTFVGGQEVFVPVLMEFRSLSVFSGSSCTGS